MNSFLPIDLLINYLIAKYVVVVLVVETNTHNENTKMTGGTGVRGVRIWSRKGFVI